MIKGAEAKQFARRFLGIHPIAKRLQDTEIKELCNMVSGDYCGQKDFIVRKHTHHKDNKSLVLVVLNLSGL